MKRSIQNNRSLNCPVCDGTKKTKVIKNIAQIGKYHLGKEVTEECKFCSKEYSRDFYEPEEATIQ